MHVRGPFEIDVQTSYFFYLYLWLHIKTMKRKFKRLSIANVDLELRTYFFYLQYHLFVKIFSTVPLGAIFKNLHSLRFLKETQ